MLMCVQRKGPCGGNAALERRLVSESEDDDQPLIPKAAKVAKL